MKQFEAAIFDMDGLLLDSEKLCFEAFREVCRVNDLSDLESVFYRCLGTTGEASDVILRDGLSSFMDHKEFNRAWSFQYKLLTADRALPVKEGVVELLDFLSTLGLPIAVATSTKTESAQSKLGHSGIIQYFDSIIGGDQVSRSKPEPDIYLKAAASIQARPEKCIAFEDSENGVKAAIGAAMTVVQVPDIVAPSEDLLRLGHVALDSLSDVVERFSN